MLLIGGPGIGKTDALRGAVDLWAELPTLHVAPSSVSRASLIDELNSAERTVLRPSGDSPFTKFNSLAAAVTEFGTFLSAYETEFMSTLNDLYDNVRYKERKRHMKQPIEMPNPQLSILAGTTPAWLSTSLPDSAWAEGFSSRLIMVYSGERLKVNPWDETAKSQELFYDLVHDLKDIHNMFGQVHFEEEVAAAYLAWYMADCPPAPEHPKLHHYIPRRHIHLMKICIVMACQRGGDYTVRLEDYQAAMDLLLEAEMYMPDVFKEMKGTQESSIMDECYAFIYADFAKTGAPMQEHRIVHFLSQRLPIHTVIRTLELMQQANMIQVAAIGDKGRNTYRPSPKVNHNS